MRLCRIHPLAGLALWAALLTATGVFGADYSAAQKARLVAAIGDRLERSAVAYGTDFRQWDALAAKREAELAQAATAQEIESALDMALNELNVSHLSLFSPETRQLARRGMRAGLGISIRESDDGLFVTHVVKGSPAWRCGIRKLDTLIAIDGVRIENVEQLAGTIGSRRALTWRRGGTTLQGEAVYAVFPIAEKSSMFWIRGDVAVIKIESFQRPYYDLAAVNRYFRAARSAKAIVLDLRNNRGGLSLHSRHLASKFASCHDTFALLVNKPRYRQAVRESSEFPPPLGPLAQAAKRVHPLPFSRAYRCQVVILVDGLSASGADIFPAFMRETGRAVVIGEPTAGALQLARAFRLPYGFRLYAPIGELLSPQGARLEGRGLEPDVKLDFRAISDDEVALRTALQTIDQRDVPSSSPLP